MRPLATGARRTWRPRATYSHSAINAAVDPIGYSSRAVLVGISTVSALSPTNHHLVARFLVRRPLTQTNANTRGACFPTLTLGVFVSGLESLLDILCADSLAYPGPSAKFGLGIHDGAAPSAASTVIFTNFSNQLLHSFTCPMLEELLTSGIEAFSAFKQPFHRLSSTQDPGTARLGPEYGRHRRSRAAYR